MTGYIKTMREKIGRDRLTIVGGGVLVCRDGQVLLQKRRDNGMWALHGGCVEIGEPVEAAARRELLEETGLIAHDLELFGVFSGPEMLYTYPNGDEVYIVSVVYLCRSYSGEPVSETDETLALRWFPLDALPDDISPPDRIPLRALAARELRGGAQE